jgi:hypothetical protein
MKVMAKQATKRVSTVNLSDGQYTQTGKETLKELFKVHFPDSRLIDDSAHGQEELNWGVCGSRMNRGDRNKSEIKMRWNR